MARDKPVASNSITLAAVTGAHGVAGEVRLKLLGEGLETLKAHRSFNDGGLTLTRIRSDGKGGAIARFAEVSGRNEAEALRGTTLSVSREALPALEDGEFYHADLIGLAVVTQTGDPVGKVVAVENFGATDIVEIERHPAPAKGPKTFMVPLTKAAVIAWDGERMTIDAQFAE